MGSVWDNFRIILGSVSDKSAEASGLRACRVCMLPCRTPTPAFRGPLPYPSPGSRLAHLQKVRSEWFAPHPNLGQPKSDPRRFKARGRLAKTHPRRSETLQDAAMTLQDVKTIEFSLKKTSIFIEKQVFPHIILLLLLQSFLLLKQLRNAAFRNPWGSTAPSRVPQEHPQERLGAVLWRSKRDSERPNNAQERFGAVRGRLKRASERPKRALRVPQERFGTAKRRLKKAPGPSHVD